MADYTIDRIKFGDNVYRLTDTKSGYITDVSDKVDKTYTLNGETSSINYNSGDGTVNIASTNSYETAQITTYNNSVSLYSATSDTDPTISHPGGSSNIFLDWGVLTIDAIDNNVSATHFDPAIRIAPEETTIKYVVTPTEDEDAANKQYVDDSISAITIPTITLNGSVTTSPSFYAPTTAGANGQVLISSGSGAPTWKNIGFSNVTTDSATITLAGQGYSFSRINTKNTAGSTNSTSKLYLIGATSQADNPQTYSNSKLYYDSGLNSTVSSATLSSAITQSSTQIKLGTTENGTGGAEIEVSTSGFGVEFWYEDLLHKINYIWADLSGLELTGLVTPVNNQDAATKKYVDDSIPTISLNGTSTASAAFYAPTTAGTSGYYLKSNGSGAPTWAAIPSGGVNDVTVGGTSVVTNGVAVVPAIPTVPTNVSAFTNDAGYLTAHQTIPVTDVTLNGSSIVSGGLAAITNSSGDVTFNGTVQGNLFYMDLSTSDSLYTAINTAGWTSAVIV